MDHEKLTQSIERLRSGDLTEKVQAARDLGNAAGDENTDIFEAADALIECLSNGDESLRASAAMALYNSTNAGNQLAGKIAKLKAAVNDEFFGVRYYAIPLMAILAEKGADISEALPELSNQLVVETDNQIRTNLALAFFYAAQGGCDISTAIPILVTALTIPDQNPIFYRNLSDAVLAFVRRHPDQTAYVRVIVECSSLLKNQENAQDMIKALGL